MSKKHDISDETVAQAMHIAKSTQQAGQTKEQTKLIAKGIEKGISQFKAQEKAKKRERDKQLKKQKNQAPTKDENQTNTTNTDSNIGTPVLIRFFAAMGVIALAAMPILWFYREAVLEKIC